MADTALARFRFAAAQASGGISNDMIYKAVLDSALSRVSSGDLLDLGAGTGNLLLRLYEMRRFSRVVGADTLPRPSNLPDEVAWIQQDLNEPIALPDQSFDAVLAVEVIEHLENPRALARELYRLLRPAGIAVVSTPNNESWRSLLTLLFRGHFVAFTDPSYPAHLTALVRKDLHRILTEAGFTDVVFRFTDHGSIPRMPRWTWQGIGGRLFRGLRYSDNLIAVALKPA